MRCPPSPQRRRGIHSYKMDGNSGDLRQRASISQVLKHAEEDGTTSLLDTDSKDSDDPDSGTDYQLTDKPKYRKEKTATQYKQPWQEYYHILVYIAVFATLIFLYVRLYITQDTAKVKEISVREAIEHIREEFPSQLEHIWGEFSAGINDTALRTPTKPSVFMLLYETEEGTAICLAQKVGNMSTHLLQAEKSDPLLIIDGEELEHNKTLAEDFGKLLEEYCPKVEEQRVMIINNLHKVPGIVAQAFHSFCDTVQPAVEKAVYLFTMKVSGVISNSHNPTKVAEEELQKLWSGELGKDTLNPLIARITDMAMIITPEENLAPCGS